MAGLQNVLLVEDDVMIRELYRETLARAGYTVQVAGDSDEAFLLLPKYKADVIFLDIMLPGRSGIDILKTLRADGHYGVQDSKIVLLTNLAQEVLAQEAMANHADGYIIKAEVNPPDLVKVIQSFA